MGILVLLLVPGVMAGVRLDAPALVEQGIDDLALRKHFRDHELQLMDPHDYRERLATGALDLTLRGHDFRVAVRPVPWDTSYRMANLRPDGSVEITEPDFQPVAYTGTVVGEPGSRALFVVSGAGVFGYVQTSSLHIAFEPVRFTQDLAPRGVSTVFDWADAILPEFPGHGTVYGGSDSPAAANEVGMAAGRPGDNRWITLWLDVELANKPDGANRLTTAYNAANAEFWNDIGFSFQWVDNLVWTCNPCTSTTDETMLNQFATHVNQAGQTWSNYHVATIMSGKDFPNIAGLGDQPGRYSLAEGHDGIDQWGRTYILMHEWAHNFNAWHSRGKVYQHHHGGGTYQYHSTIMTGYGNSEKLLEYSSLNVNAIRGCNANTWSNGWKNRDAYSEAYKASFGAHCFTGNVWEQRGGEGPNYFIDNHRGKLFTEMTHGDIASICVWGLSPGTYADVAMKRRPTDAQVLLTVRVNVHAQAWNCASLPPGFAEYNWHNETLFLYKVAGDAWIGYDTLGSDGMVSLNGGQTWTSEARRPGFAVEMLSSRLPPDVCGQLAPGQSIAPGATLVSCNGKYHLTHQLDGNVVLYNHSTSPVKVDWATHTPNQATTTFIMQGDGNAVLYSGGTPLWSSGTGGNAGAWFSLGDNGILQVVGKSGEALWFEGCGLLGRDAVLRRGMEIRSCSREYSLAHQTDGNVVLYRNGVYDGWATHTGGWSSTTEFKMQNDGNLVLYTTGGPIWASDSAGNPWSRLRLQDNGKLIIYTMNDTAICWKMRC